MAATVLNDAQIDILNMMRWVKSDETLNDLKQAISDFFAKKAKEEMDAMWAEMKRLENPQTYYVDLSYELWKLKNDMLGNKTDNR